MVSVELAYLDETKKDVASLRSAFRSLCEEVEGVVSGYDVVSSMTDHVVSFARRGRDREAFTPYYTFPAGFKDLAEELRSLRDIDVDRARYEAGVSDDWHDHGVFKEARVFGSSFAFELPDDEAVSRLERAVERLEEESYAFERLRESAWERVDCDYSGAGVDSSFYSFFITPSENVLGPTRSVENGLEVTNLYVIEEEPEDVVRCGTVDGDEPEYVRVDVPGDLPFYETTLRVAMEQAWQARNQ
jgi:hypothetical protein